MHNRFGTCEPKSKKQASALSHCSGQLQADLINLFDTHLPHPTNSSNEERVAYLENQRLKIAVKRVLDAV